VRSDRRRRDLRGRRPDGGRPGVKARADKIIVCLTAYSAGSLPARFRLKPCEITHRLSRFAILIRKPPHMYWLYRRNITLISRRSPRRAAACSRKWPAWRTASRWPKASAAQATASSSTVARRRAGRTARARARHRRQAAGVAARIGVRCVSGGVDIMGGAWQNSPAGDPPDLRERPIDRYLS
jgi:hypothetical protein